MLKSICVGVDRELAVLEGWCLLRGQASITNTARGGTAHSETKRGPMSRYKWVWHGETKLYDVGILPDGTLHNPHSYPEDLAHAAVSAADARRYQRCSEAAKKAAVTRRKRQEKRALQTARRLLANSGIGERLTCAVCVRGLADSESIKRGIGSECWGNVLALVQLLREQEKPLDSDTRGTQAAA
jgi:hypothetical protein